LCRVIGEGGSEPKPGRVEARWEYHYQSDAAVGSGISISRALEDKGKGVATDKETEDDNPFADENGPLSPAAKDLRSWADVTTIRKLVSGKYEAK
jgi:hypothetical protein